MLKEQYTEEDIYLKYIKPYLALPLFRSQEPYIYELEEYFGDIKFENFNRPLNEKFDIVRESEFGPVRLPHTFCHWTYKVTAGIVMIVDV